MSDHLTQIIAQKNLRRSFRRQNLPFIVIDIRGGYNPGDVFNYAGIDGTYLKIKIPDHFRAGYSMAVPAVDIRRPSTNFIRRFVSKYEFGLAGPGAVLVGSSPAATDATAVTEVAGTAATTAVTASVGTISVAACRAAVGGSGHAAPGGADGITGFEAPGIAAFEAEHAAEEHATDG
jgi:hypothetical protein